MRACLVLICLLFCLGAAEARSPGIISLFYYVANDPASPAILEANAKRISIIAPQTFVMDADGFVMGEVPAEVKRVARQNRIPIMPLVVNGWGFKPEVMQAVLDDVKKQERAIRYLLYYAKREGAVGFQFDYENIHYGYRDKFTAFTERAARAFHRRGLLLTLAVVGRENDRRDDANPGGWDYWSGIYDYRRLGKAADFLSIMAYPEHSDEPGSVGSIPWMEQLAEYTLGEVPRAKISWGIPVYPMHWTQKPGAAKWERGHGRVNVWALRQRAGVSDQWDQALASGSIEYTEDGARHVIWYEDARSVRAKLQFIQRHRFQGFSAWRLGSEDPESWKLLGGEFPVARFQKGIHRK